jgi:hypothetical protein
MCLCNIHQLLLQMCQVFLFLNLHQSVYYSNFVVSVVFANPIRSCQFGLIESFALLYNGVWQSSYKNFITMLGWT